MRIVLLGTSSAVPKLTRGLSATALVREGDVFLFDCGEGTQLQLMRSSVKRSRIHSIFCLGWRFQEKDRPGVFNLERAEELGIPRGSLYGRLQHGESITLGDGRVIMPDMVLGPPRPGKSVVYCLDTQFSERSIQLA